MNALDLFLFEHAHVHAAAVAPSEIINVEDLLYAIGPQDLRGPRDCEDAR